MNQWDVLRTVLVYDQDISRSMSLEMPVADTIEIILDLMMQIEDGTKVKDLVDRPESFKGKGLTKKP